MFLFYKGCDQSEKLRFDKCVSHDFRIACLLFHFLLFLEERVKDKSLKRDFRKMILGFLYLFFLLFLFLGKGVRDLTNVEKDDFRFLLSFFIFSVS